MTARDVPSTPAAVASSEERCDRAPIGWQCTRLPSHPGPCAALPTLQPESDLFARQLAPQIAALLRGQVVIVDATAPSQPPPAPRPSLPVRAATNGYKLTKGAAALLGLLVAIAEMVAPDHGVARAIFRALFEPSAP